MATFGQPALSFLSALIRGILSRKCDILSLVSEDKISESRNSLKPHLGRSFVTTRHEGRSAAHNTENLASQRLGKALPKKEVTKQEWQTLTEDYPSDTKIMLGQGMSRQEIFDALNRREIN